MTYEWQDLPEPKNCFTVRNTASRDLRTGRITQNYSTNTKIAVVQKCVTIAGTYYRTDYARRHNLDVAFEASALGLPKEQAPPGTYTLYSYTQTPEPRSKKMEKNKKSPKAEASPKGGEAKPRFGWVKRLFRREK